MDGRDLQRRLGLRNRPARESLEALRRNQAPPKPGSAADCLRAGRDVEKKLEPVRKAMNAG
jgi:hypothetical protein